MRLWCKTEGSLSLQMDGAGVREGRLAGLQHSLSLVDDGWRLGKVGTLDGSDTARVGSLLLPTTDLQKHMMAYKSILTKAFSPANLLLPELRKSL